MEDLEKQVQTETTTATEQKQEIRLDDLPRLEDLIKSEQDVKRETKLQGLTSAEQSTGLEDRPFTRKEDERKKFVKKRLKLVTGIYITVAALLLSFFGVNLATMIRLDKDITNNVNTIQKETEHLEYISGRDEPDGELTEPTIQVTLNQPRDYNDDNNSLTLLDKLTILFRGLFG